MKKILLSVVATLTLLYAHANPIDSLEKTLKVAKGENKVKVYNELFRMYINSDPVKAIGYTREALMLATEVKDLKGMAAAYNNIGVSYKNQGALDKALENYLLSLHIYDSLKYNEGVATTQNNIGTIYSLKKDYSQALKYFEGSNEIFNKLNDKTKMIGSLNNLGNLHSDLQLYEQALKFYNQALELNEKLGIKNSDLYNNIGNLYYKQGNFANAIEYYKRAIVLAKDKNDKIAELNILTNMGEAYSKTNQGTKAQLYFDSALHLCKTLEAYVYEPQILRSAADNYAKQGRMKEAYDAMLNYDKAKDKIYGEESTRKIAQMEIAIDLQAKEKEVGELKQQDQIKSLELRNTRMVIVTAVLLIIVAISIFNLFMSKRRR